MPQTAAEKEDFLVFPGICLKLICLFLKIYLKIRAEERERGREILQLLTERMCNRMSVSKILYLGHFPVTHNS